MVAKFKITTRLQQSRKSMKSSNGTQIFIKILINKGLQDNFHGKNITNFQYIYNNLNKIINSIKNGTGKLLKTYGKGKYHFQIVVDGDRTKYHIITTGTYVTNHLGMKKRQSATASSDVNEYLSLYFIQHPTFTDAKTFMSDVGKLTDDTGILASGGSVTYEDLRELLDKDEKVERDILIGYNNSIAVIADLKSMKVKWSVLHWSLQRRRHLGQYWCHCQTMRQ